MEVPNQIVVFGVGTTRYALDIEAVDEILAVPEIVPLAGAPNGVVGMVDVRGRVVPVFDLRWKFGVPETGLTDASRLVLVASARVPVALLVDGVEEVRTLRGDDLQSVQPPGVQGGLGYLRGVVRGGPNLVLLVDHLALVPEAAVRSLRVAA